MVTHFCFFTRLVDVSSNLESFVFVLWDMITPCAYNPQKRNTSCVGGNGRTKEVLAPRPKRRNCLFNSSNHHEMMEGIENICIKASCGTSFVKGELV